MKKKFFFNINLQEMLTNANNFMQLQLFYAIIVNPKELI